MNSLVVRSVSRSAWNLTGRRFASSEVTRTEQQPASVEVISGAPGNWLKKNNLGEHLLKFTAEALTLERSVRIFTPTKPATQSGKNNTRTWRIDFDILEDGNRWDNPLMGWASSADYQQALQIKFYSKEAAIQFAERQGKSKK